MKSNVLFFFVFSISILMGNFCWGQSVKTWTGAVNTDWSNADNWDLHEVPNQNDSVIILSRYNNPTLTSDVVCGVLNDSTGDLSLSSYTLTVKGNVYVRGTINGDDGILLISGDFKRLPGGAYNSSTSTLKLNGTSPDLSTSFDYYNLIVNVSGTLSIDGKLKVNGDLYVNSGTLSIIGGGSITGTTGKTLIVSSGATFKTTVDTLGVTGFEFYNIEGPVIYASSSVTQTIDQNKTYNDLTLSGGATKGFLKTISGTLTVNGTLLIKTTAIFNDGGNLINVKGKWTQETSGIYISTGTVNLNGTSNQSISSCSFNNLTIENISGVTLAGSDTINGTLTLSNGLLTLGDNNLTLGESANISGTPSSTNMIVATGAGQLRKNFTGTGSFTFPVGDNDGATEYSPVTLNFTSGDFSSAYAGVNLHNTKHSNNSSSANYINRYWTITSSGISNFSCDASFNYHQNDIVGDESKLYCGKYDGSNWTLFNPVEATNNILSGTVTSFSDFTGGDATAVPVELISFTAKLVSSKIYLNWSTATEVNNFGFDVERSLSNHDWQKIGYVSGHGNCNSPQNYSFVDAANLNGNNDLKTGVCYYRLKQIDNDGSFNYSKEIEVSLNTPSRFTLEQNYPNPFNPLTVINFQLMEDSHVHLKIFDVLGNEVKTLVDENRKAGTHTIKFNASNLSSGVYMYKLTAMSSAGQAGNFSEVKKMLVLK